MDIIEKLGITENKLKEFCKVYLEWNNCQKDYDQQWLGYSALEDETNIDFKILKKLFKVLRDRKIAYHGSCQNYECELMGSGNFLFFKYQNMTENDLYDVIIGKELINE